MFLTETTPVEIILEEMNTWLKLKKTAILVFFSQQRSRNVTWILVSWIRVFVVSLLVEVCNSSSKRGDESHASISTGDCLRQGEEKSQIAVNSFLFQLSCSLYSLLNIQKITK